MERVVELKATSSKEAQIDDELDVIAQKLFLTKGNDADWVLFEELLARRGRLMRPASLRLKKRFA